MTTGIALRTPGIADAPAMARLHVASWRETYRGVVPDAVLDDPDFEARRERFWVAAMTDERHRRNRIAVAEVDGAIIGLAMAGPPLDDDADVDVQLYVLYVAGAHLGTGAGTALLNAVVRTGERAILWVADPNPRAQAFYRREGFVADGTVQVEDGIREVRMRRGSAAD